jgi:3-oxoacyl-[acyl-carrier-protein] synthase-1
VTGEPLMIVGSGMLTAVGLTAPSACAAIRCGLNNFRETRFIDAAGEPIVGSEVPLEEPWQGPTRLARMLCAVIRQSFEADPALEPEHTPVIICIAERGRPGRYRELKQRLADEVRKHMPFHVDSTIVSQGRVSAVVALREARALVYEKRHRAVIVAGVDSYLCAPTLAAYDGDRRLLTASNSDGFIPGEGASAIIVRRPVASADPRLCVVGIGFGLEQATIESERPLRADGLVDAIRNALVEARTAIEVLDFRITDLSGEQYLRRVAPRRLHRRNRRSHRSRRFECRLVSGRQGLFKRAERPVSFRQ